MKYIPTISDAQLYTFTAAGVAFLTYISGEDSWKYVNAVALWWIKGILGATIAGFNGLKAYRSMTFKKQQSPEPELKP